MAQQVDFKWDRPVGQIIADKVKNEKTLKFMAASWHRLYTPFVPMDTGALFSNVRYLAEGGAGVIHHVSPYARRLYHGTGMRFQTHKHPLASAGWDKAAESAGKKGDLARDVQAFINRGG